MTTKQFIILGSALLAVTPISQALQFQDIDDLGIAGTGASPAHNTGGVLVTTGAPYTGLFDIVTGDGDSVNVSAPYSLARYEDLAGFVPGAMNVTSATATFWFQDDQNSDASESVSVTLDGDAFASGHVFNKKVVIFGNDLNILAALNTDGKLVYIITADTGDFVFDFANLYVEADSIRVADGGSSIMLLGMGFLGFAGLRRKLA